MKDQLLDLVQHTHNLGCIDTVKISGDAKETTIDAIAEDRSVVVKGNYTTPITEFSGIFGMPNLPKLKILLNLPVYQENAKITVSTQDRNGETVPSGLHFENESGDFKNDYRFMARELITEKLKTPKFKGANWDVEFQPSAASIQRLKMQAQANSEETNLQIVTDSGNLKFLFGDRSTHAGEFVFQSEITGNLKGRWLYQINQVIAILSLVGDKTMRISDSGVAQITVNSGIAEYNYIMPAYTK